MNLEKILERHNTLLKAAAEQLCCVNTTITNIANIQKGETIQSIVSSSTITPNVDSYTATIVTAQAADFTIANPTGTPLDMQGYVIRIKATGIRNITWDTDYREIGLTLPTSIASGKVMYIGMLWNAADSKWDVTSVIVEA
jgi:hypothetical protein